MTDFQIRQAFHDVILKDEHQCTNTFVVDELGLMNGKSRADIAVLNGKMIGYEIKSDRDSLTRLPSQVLAYNRIFDKAFIIVDEKHLNKAFQIIPDWWGIYVIRQLNSQSFQFEYFREGECNKGQDSYSIVQLLWKEEAFEIATTIFQCNLKKQACKHEINVALTTNSNVNNLSKIVIEYLKKRQAWRKDPKALL